MTNRLDFSTLKHRGRQQELDSLLALVQKRDSLVDKRPPAIIIEAEAGIGKSDLLARFRSEIENCTWICYGKFEERTAASSPFEAIAEAVEDLVQHIVASGEKEKWACRIRNVLDSELDLLLNILPVLGEIFSDSEAEAAEATESSGDEEAVDFEAFGNMISKEWRFERFRLAFRGLFRCVCMHRNYALVLVLDDLHWIDPDSMQLVKTLIEDSRVGRNFLFVAASRPIEAYESLRKVLDCLPEDRARVISLERLSSDEICDLLAELLHRDRESVVRLAEIVKVKTGGNVFVVLQLLRLLENQGLVEFCPKEEKWVWDTERIMNVDSISENVSEVIAQNLENVDRRRKSALIVAASFGVSQFEVSTIVHAVRALEDEESKSFDDSSGLTDDPSNDPSDPYVVRRSIRVMNGELEEAAKDGFVEETSEGRYKFAHDRVRESAYSLLPKGSARKELHLKVGRQLRSWMDMQSELGESQAFSEESLLFHAAKQLNSGADLIEDPWERLDLASVNYHAAELAAQKASFYSSMEYLQMGLSHLGNRSWEEHYDLTLKFCVALTRMQYTCGLLNECMETADSVINNGRLFRDKRAVYHTKLHCLIQQERRDDATSLVLSILDQLGESLPRRFLMLHAILDFFKIRRFFKNVSDEEILNRDEVHDEQLDDYMEFMERLGEIAMLGGNTGYIILYSLRLPRIMMERGNYPRSFYALLSWAWFKVQFGDFAEGHRWSKLGVCLADRQSGRGQLLELKARLDLACWFYINHWQVPIRHGLAPLASAFAELWTNGYIDYVHMDKCAMVRLMFACGEPLELLARECDKFSESLQDYNQTIHWNINAPLFQAVLNLQGRSAKPTVLTGDYMNEEDCKASWKKTGNKLAEFQWQFFVMVLAYHFHDLKLAEEVILGMRKDIFEDGPDVLVPMRLLYSGLVYMSLFKETRKRKYRRKAMPILRQLRTWAGKGAVNCVYMYLLLEAEEMAFCTSKSRGADAVLNAYDKAIAAVAETGLCHHQALANELAAAYLCEQRTDSSRAAPYITKAIELYQQWGATAKVEDVKARYRITSDYCDSGTALSSSIRREEFAASETSFTIDSAAGGPLVIAESGR